MAGVDLLGLTGGPGNGPNGLFPACGTARGIRHVSGSVLAATADIHQRISIGRKTQRGEILAIVLVVFSELSRGEPRRFRNPNVSLALLVENPGHAITVFCCGQIRREWSAAKNSNRVAWVFDQQG